jgi:type IV fimbrial biogenesis protein FimT
MGTKRGFTVVEVMVVIGIIAILAAVAVPNIVGWRAKQRFLAAMSDVHETVKMARSWAIKNNATVVINFNLAQRTFTAFDDQNGNGSLDGGELIRSGGFLNDITMNTSFPGHRLTFNGRGLSDAVGAGITLSHAVYGSRVVQVTVTGNTQVL